MAVTQRFSVSAGEWVCTGCGAFMVENTDVEPGGQAPAAVKMTHADGCSEVAALRA